MLKKDFKSGMILHFENGDKGLLLDQEIFLFNKKSDFSGSLSLSYYNENKKSLNKFQLIKVLKPNTPKTTNIGANLSSFMNNINHKILVWEKPKHIEELTLEQICKELGRDIKIIKG